MTGPVFLGGAAYSGKTPLRIALDAHPRLSVTRHTAMWKRFYRRFGDLAVPANLGRCLTIMLADERVSRLDPDRARIERELALGPPSYGRLFALLHAHHAERSGKARWGDQMGLIERYADPIFQAYPDARMIHLVRDPTTLPHGRVPGRLGWETARWCSSAALAQRNRQRYPGGYRVVRYEALVGDPERVLSDVLAFIGEDVEPRMADVLVRHLPSSAGGSPRPAVSGKRRSAAAFVQRHAGAHRSAFGYPSVDGAARGRHDRRPRVVDHAGLGMWRALGRGAPALVEG